MSASIPHQARASADDHRLASELAQRAGEMLLDLRARLTSEGASARVLRDEGDRRSQSLLEQALAQARPDDAVLSEEAADDRARLSASRVWLIDPLDGTREFAEEGRCDWAVHVALAIDERPAAGAVALPASAITLDTSSPPALPPRGSGPLKLVVSRSRPPSEAQIVADALGAQVMPLGSAGAKAMAVVRGDADLYVHAGGQYEWDSCAPVAVALSAGCSATRLDGTDLRYNQPDPYLPDLLICRPELHESALKSLL